MAYKIKLEIFEGPLDLLLYLVKKDHLNIYDIPIAQVTEQYLRYLELMRLLDLNVAGDFLVMAATLIQIKSRMLLPAQDDKPQPQEEEDDPRAELVQRLLEYERFKEIAEHLRKRQIKQQEIFKRPAPAQLSFEKKDDSTEVYFEASIFDLINAFSAALKDVPRQLFYEVIKDEFTIEEAIHRILHLLVEQEKIFLSSLFNLAKNRLEIIATFLAILELMHLKEVIAYQKEPFAEIEVVRNKENIVPRA
jgi:segregation and condensation protein A